MNIRQAILRAADHIQRAPQEFKFHSIPVPSKGGCGTPGCALGWIACFAGKSSLTEAALWLGIQEESRSVTGVFYDRMDAARPAGAGSWIVDASSCAATLRAYADKYHPATAHAAIPDNVLGIFSMTPEQIRRELTLST